MKPHIRKVKGSPYWDCDGALAKTPRGAFARWMVRQCFVLRVGV